MNPKPLSIVIQHIPKQTLSSISDQAHAHFFHVFIHGITILSTFQAWNLKSYCRFPALPIPLQCYILQIMEVKDFSPCTLTAAGASFLPPTPGQSYRQILLKHCSDHSSRLCSQDPSCSCMPRSSLLSSFSSLGQIVHPIGKQREGPLKERSYQLKRNWSRNFTCAHTN